MHGRLMRSDELDQRQLDKNLSVETLVFVRDSRLELPRRFTDDVGQTPAAFVERLRSTGRVLLEAATRQNVPQRCRLRTLDRLGRSFENGLAQSIRYQARTLVVRLLTR